MNANSPMGYFAASYSSSVSEASLNIIGAACPTGYTREVSVRGTKVTYCAASSIYQTWWQAIGHNQFTRSDMGRIYRGIMPQMYLALHDEVINGHDPVLGGINGVHVNLGGNAAIFETSAPSNESLVNSYFSHLETIYVGDPLTFTLHQTVCDPNDPSPLRATIGQVEFGGEEDAITVHALFVDPERYPDGHPKAGGLVFQPDGRLTVVDLRWITFKFQFRGSDYPGQFYADGLVTFNPINTPPQVQAPDFELVPDRTISWCPQPN